MKDTITQRTPLHYAAFVGNLEIARKLLCLYKKNHKETESLIDCQDDFQFTALHIAAKYGHLRITKLLLCKGADPNKLTNCGVSALHFLARCNPPMDDPIIVNRFKNTMKVCYYFFGTFNTKYSPYSS